MKKVIVLLSLSFSSFLFSQVGVNTSSPKATLQIGASPTENTVVDGLIPPVLKGNELQAKVNLYKTDQTGTLIYISEPVSSPTPPTADIDIPGYYYFNGTKWVKFGASNLANTWFYAPSIALPTSPSGVPTTANSGVTYDANTKEYTVNLYDIYAKQFNVVDATVNPTFVKSNTSSSLNTFSSNQLDFFIVYYDNSVYDPNTITLSADGILTYKVLTTGIVTQNTYMNVIFKEK